MTTGAPVVVGIDGGEASAEALEFARREAQLRHTHVVALTCWPSTGRADDAGPLLCATHEQAAELLEHVVRDAQLRRPSPVLVVSEVTQNLAGPALVAASRTAELVVLGSKTRGPSGRHHGRRTIEHCLLYAESPVVVVPRAFAAEGLAEVAVDLSQPSMR